jgi:large subunit ribosomal protein L6
MEKSYEIPQGVEVTVHGLHVTVKGHLGELSKDFSDPRFNELVKIEKHGSTVKVSTEHENKKIKAVVGTINAHVKNMSLGVSKGYKYELKILYTHFPITVTHSGDKVEVKNFFGEKSIRTAKIVGKTEIKVDKETITLTGINVEDVGQTAANLERACKLRNRDRRIFQDGIFLDNRKLKTGENI